jgi:DNA invertase Pin-like site-specific DNA recombinase
LTDAAKIGCVVYAAKSTEDRRGSIPDQLRECRAAIEYDATRERVGEYFDESFSAYSGDRGPGLAEAMRQVEELAAAGPVAELWTQHSDRLARGDGRSARHVVEIALWALKRGVVVRTLQDPDTFRDLLYAVVVGQRNHEDSRRRSLSVSAGHRRAVERGEHRGYCPDGYKFVLHLDGRAAVVKRLAIDEDREPVIRMIFRLALRGKQPGQITTALNKAGHLTPWIRGKPPVPWRVAQVCGVLRNPRYAGMATHKGEVLARGQWPAYITEAEHRRIIGRIGSNKPTKYPRVLEPYLLTNLGRCGHCGSPLYAMTGHERIDGTLLRRYVCASHARNYDPGRCSVRPISAGTIEGMFVASIATLLLDSAERPIHDDAATAGWTHSLERDAVLRAVQTGDDTQINAALHHLLASMSPDATVARQLAISHRAARQLAATRRLEIWAKTEQTGRTDSTRQETLALNRLLRSWFESVSVTVSDVHVDILAKRQPALGQPGSSEARITISLQDWARAAAPDGRAYRPWHTWRRAEILGALQGWADMHGRSPRYAEWRLPGGYHPSALTVRNTFGSWAKALLLAGLAPTFPRIVLRNRPWTNEDILLALRIWIDSNGRIPTTREWKHATHEHPAAETIRCRFGSWNKAIATARAT